MLAPDTHLSDQQLIAALDHYATGDRLGASAHVNGCALCRSRQQQLAAATSAALAGYHTPSDDERQVVLSRARLKASLDELARGGQSTRSPIGLHWRLVRWAAVAAAVLVGVALTRGVISQHRGFGAATTQAEDGALPNAALTPGAAWDVSLDELCQSRDREQQPIPLTVRRGVVRAYGMEGVSESSYELDYLITPELGGAPVAANLWPQRYESHTWNAGVKDQLEQLLPTLACNQTVSLQQAQREIAANWIAAYRKYFRTDLPIRADIRGRDRGDLDLASPSWRSRLNVGPRLIAFTTQ